VSSSPASCSTTGSGIPGDFSTPKQSISVLPPFGRWEACLTTNDTWGWHATDHRWKSPAQIVRALAVCASGAGNLLLNIAPKGDGSLPAPAVELLEAVGAWLAVNGASVYGTTRSPWLAHAYGVITCAPRRLFLHCFSWPAEGEIRLGFLASRATDARLLAGGEPVAIEQRDDVLTVRGLPGDAPDDLDTVIEVELDGGPDALPGSYVFWAGEARY
jgi:alpha-L-fucosidase